jgi:hypothetical protein
MPTTRQEFIDRHFHLLCGLLLDAAVTQRTGAELSLWLRTAQRKVADLLGQCHSDLYPVAAPTRKGGAA